MNWAKGRKTRGRGTSFKGALVYALHDKDAATKDRVGFVELRNLATDNPDRAWSEMMALCEAADDLKRRAGGKATGRKLTQPVYAFTLNWHEEDRPDADQMRDTALDALKALGMDGLQAVIIEHTDRPHRHVHVIVNLVDPDTGKAASLSNDEHKLDRWADSYEVKQGVIRSPARRAKFHALDNGLPPPKREPQASTREEWEATRGQNGREANAKAAEIRAAFAARIAGLKETNEDRYRKSRSEGDQLWSGYQADKKAIRDRYQPFIDAVFKSKRNSAPNPYTEQAFRDLEETSEWKALGRRQFQQRKAFKIRERHSLGVIANAVRLHYANLRRGGLSALFMLAISGARRQRLFDEVQQYDKLVLKKSQADRRKLRADTLRAACRHELAQRAATFQQARKAMLDRHAAEGVAMRGEWRQLAEDRKQAWADHWRNFGRTQQEEAADRMSSVNRRFNEAASGKEREADSGKAGGESRGSQGDAGSSGPVQPKAPQKGGWKARRNAAQRQSDGTYQPRNRPGRGKDRGR
jgi:hypothetical protein